MYITLLAIHSLSRWLVLLTLVFSTGRAYQGWLTNQVFSKRDNLLRIITSTIAHIQLTIGLWLYFVSPVVGYFLNNFKDAVHQRDIRFFGMEHITMMTIAISLITIGSIKVKRKKSDVEKFKAMAIWFTIALIIIFVSIPWSFSPFTSRPYYRSF
jgi:hypothetical protein